MENESKQGMGVVYQGNAEIGMYPYEIAEAGQSERTGFLYVGDRAQVLTALLGKELSLHVEDGTLYKFYITDVASKMSIKVTKSLLH